ncbi:MULTISPECIES: hypothetical protein [unclassified Sphingobium]|uniref:hypothetical protein n=1 Tax=unclassified Sphingobium TaxID=2611147 RepID=UPI003447AEE1
MFTELRQHRPLRQIAMNLPARLFAIMLPLQQVTARDHRIISMAGYRPNAFVLCTQAA